MVQVTRAHARIGILSTYPPKLCGLATFAAALERELRRAGHAINVVRIDDGDGSADDRPVAGTLRNGSAESLHAAASVLSQGDVAIVQHEYGIFGGADGQDVIDLLDALEVPAIVVLHTVPVTPSPNQYRVLADVLDRADRIVVMAEAARSRLTSLYPLNQTPVSMIPHGASHSSAPSTLSSSGQVGRNLLTWGLLGPGKGIEHAVDAMALLGDMRISPRYTVAGVTHPKVFLRDGNSYRDGLKQRSIDKGVAASVVFDDAYRTVEDLMRFVARSSVVVLPYDSRDQVTSGVLVDALVAGRPVIATAFPHAVELLDGGAGILVPHEDPDALARAIRTALTDVGRHASMAAAARALAPSLRWSTVAKQYADLADDAIACRRTSPVSAA